MDPLPIRDMRLLEALEACRPGSNDIGEADMAPLSVEMAASPKVDELYERLQGVDATVAQAFADVPVPEGLAERILARIRSADPASPAKESALAEAIEPTVAVPIARDGVAPPRLPRGSLPRVWGWVAAAAMLLVAVGIGVAVYVNTRSQDYTCHDAADQGIALFSQEQAGRRTAQAATPTLLAEYPFGSSISAGGFATRAREIQDFLGQAAVAYDLLGPQDRVVATLYVTDIPISGLPASPPDPPQGNTQGKCSGVWSAGGLVYVFVVDGDESVYRQFIPQSDGPIA